ncbi:MAG TPA: hypothetical protein VNB54_06925 [Alphaproteobacteria bacterium]|nr:hypothetical protein [Alphaproteobacteria bacterium]
MTGRNETQFLNVDLDIYSRSHLEPLVEALKGRPFIHYVGRERGCYAAHISLSSHGQTADALIRNLGRLIKKLPKSARALWDSATSREFNVGIQSGYAPQSYEVRVNESTVVLLSELNASIVVTTYAAMERSRSNAALPKAQSQVTTLQRRRRERV